MQTITHRHRAARTYSVYHLALLVFVAFALRAAVFNFWLQNDMRYRQPDSFDYHYLAVGIAHGAGVVRLDNGTPLFWRTPGYPYFLTPFYTKKYNAKFEDYQADHKRALWFQIILCSFIPLLVFFLGLLLTASTTIAWITAWIIAVHPGFVLASGYLLTDALAHLLFTIFLLFFYRSFQLWCEDATSTKNTVLMLICAAVILGMYAWFRPIGRYFMFISCILLLLSHTSIYKKMLRIALFASIFFVMIAPWCIRNYRATGSYFFCPMSGPYLQTFVAPKIIRDLTGEPLMNAINSLSKQVMVEHAQQQKMTDLLCPGTTYPQEFACLTVAQPWCTGHPYYFALEWMREVFKTTFDLYTTQFVAYQNNSFSYDPPEEFLTQKLAEALYVTPLALWVRTLVWLEALFLLLVWIGLLAGCYLYVLQPLFKLMLKKGVGPQARTLLATWIKAGFFIGGMLIMTGGFGYARLRMPIDPLMFILSLTFWYNLWKSYMPRGEKNL